MKTTAELSVEHDERKRLGQYFTGEALSRLLAALGSAEKARSVVDPMAGSGDMLVAAVDVGAPPSGLVAVEIDPRAARVCERRLGALGSRSAVRTADAFSPETWKSSSQMAWDLVITNPPYVRYQRSSQAAVGRVATPSALGIREGLREIVQARATLSDADRELLATLVGGYSGLADLAVPSWLLCASLVAPDGRLAMVVPDTWLSRNYALPVLYMLRRCFDIEHIVEDGEAAWFEDALVRTTLVVARRVATRPSALHAATRSHAYARLTSDAATKLSIVGALHPRSPKPELRFAERLRRVARSGESEERAGLSATRASDRAMHDRLLAQGTQPDWMVDTEPPQRSPRRGSGVPRLMLERLGRTSLRTCYLSDLGWNVGQGLRTGANGFFYAESHATTKRITELSVEIPWDEPTLAAPNEVLRVVVRKQQDLLVAAGNTGQSRGRLLYLDDFALPEDIERAHSLGVSTPYRPLPEPLAAYVRRAADAEFGTGASRKVVPQLSAVVTNVRPPDPRRPDRPARFWYQLPPLAPRHVGALFVPRINHWHPTTMSNDAGVLIDANFSTLWPTGEARVTAYALLAVLRSSWALVAMEASGTVLGGGALKLEATQMRRLPLPALTDEACADLDALGRALIAEEHPEALSAQVDAVVWSCLGGLSRRAIHDLVALRRNLVHARNPRAPRPAVH